MAPTLSPPQEGPLSLSFVKMHGAGNDFVMIADPDRALERSLTRAQVARLCHRRLGIGADGLILGQPAVTTPDMGKRLVRMVYYNADGGLSTFCGNGARCFAIFVDGLGWGDLSAWGGLTFVAADGPHRAWRRPEDPKGLVHLQMRPTLPIENLSLDTLEGLDRLPGVDHITTLKWVDTGSPHLVVGLKPGAGLDRVDETGPPLSPGGWAFELAKGLRHHARWAAKGGTNVNLCPALPTDQDFEVGPVILYTFERGVEDFTLACGTGVVAAALCRAATSKASSPIGEGRHIRVNTQGGGFTVFLPGEGSQDEGPVLTGPTARVCAGVLDNSLLEAD